MVISLIIFVRVGNLVQDIAILFLKLFSSSLPFVSPQSSIFIKCNGKRGNAIPQKESLNELNKKVNSKKGMKYGISILKENKRKKKRRKKILRRMGANRRDFNGGMEWKNDETRGRMMTALPSSFHSPPAAILWLLNFLILTHYHLKLIIPYFFSFSILTQLLSSFFLLFSS